MSNDLIPISDEQAKLLTEALKTLQGFGGFLRKILGTVPEDLVALCGGDWLKVRRLENLAAMLNKAQEHLKLRGVIQTEQANLKVALPLLEAAANEGQEKLQDTWARLLAAAVDPKRAGQVRLDFIEAVKRMEPVDARILKRLAEVSETSSNARDEMVTGLGLSSDQVDVSFQNLHHIGLVDALTSGGGLSIGGGGAVSAHPRLTAMGRELLRALED